MTRTRYVVEFLNKGNWEESSVCRPCETAEEAEALRQKHFGRRASAYHTRVRKVKSATMGNLIESHVRTPGRATVLLPPGLGDIHWVFLKLEGFLSRHGFTGADAWIWDVGGPRRSAEFVQRVPFVHYVDYINIPDRYDRRDVHNFCQQTNPVMPNTFGFDFVIAFNGLLEAGLPLDTAMDGASINWHYPIIQTEEECRFAQLEKEKGPWVLLYFSSLGRVFNQWTEIITPNRVIELIRLIKSTYPHHRVKMVGLPWDEGFSDRIQGVEFENLVGKTNPDEYFALLRGAEAMVGFANGNGILATHFGVPTVMIWNRERYPHMAFRTNWVSPHSRYLPVEIEDFNPSQIIDALNNMTDKQVSVHV